MPFFCRTLIQLLICAVTVLLAFVISGGIPDESGFGTGRIFVLVEICVGFAFWIGSMVFSFEKPEKSRISYLSKKPQACNKDCVFYSFSLKGKYSFSTISLSK